MALNPTTSSLYSLKPKNFTMRPQAATPTAVGPVVPSAQFPLAGRAETTPKPAAAPLPQKPVVSLTPTPKPVTPFTPQVSQAPLTPSEQTVPVTPSVADNFRVDFNGTYPSTALASDVTNVDLNALLQRNQKQVSDLQQQLLDASAPTAAENDVQSQILAVRDQAAAAQQNLANYDIATQQGTMGLEGQGRGIPAEVIRGEQVNLANQRAFLRQGQEAEISRYAQQEQNLMTRLGLEQEKRTGMVDRIKTALGFSQQEMDNQLKVQQAIQSQQQQYLAQTSQLRDDARQTLGLILQNFKGLEFGELDQASQQQLSALGARAGIPAAMIQEGLRVSKNEQLLGEMDVEKKKLENEKLRQDLGLSPLTRTGENANLDTFMQALTGQESGGNPTAQNERTGAYGLFQIMPGNWPAWSQEAGLPPGSEQTPENQTAVAKFKLDQYYKKFGNWADVASAWYSGKPFTQVEREGWADEPQGDGSEPSVRQYVQQVLGKLPSSTRYVKPDDAAKLNKEIASSDQYKAITKARDVLEALNNFRSEIDKTGEGEYSKLQFTGGDAYKLSRLHRELLLVLKEYFNLGVLNGPDEAILTGILPDPTSFQALFKGGDDAVFDGIEDVRNRVYQTLSDRSNDLLTAYRDYSPQQLTNLLTAQKITEDIKKEKDLKSQIGADEMLVRDKKSGTIGSIKKDEFDSGYYERI